MTPPVVVTIAGTDSGGAAGVAADLTTFAALGVHGACVVTAVTAQDTLGVRAVHRIPLDAVEAQLDAVLEDLDPPVVKTGMLGSAEVVELVAHRCADRVLVVDPVLVATSGVVLGDDDVVAAYRAHLLPVAAVSTPNADEHARLAPFPTPVLRTGGDEPPTRGTCVDVLERPGAIPLPLSHDTVPTSNDHGTGCTYSAALAAHLAHGRDVADAARLAARFTTDQLRTSSTWTLGRGRGPVAHTIPTTATGGSA
jgi:hydroxymethylpyrimidine/phosphomethylpyrimidine kinase